jgi:hypothetical protein
MLARWNQEAIKRIVARAKAEETDLETVLVDELVRYLEGHTGLFEDLGANGSISLHEIVQAGMLASTREENLLRLSALIDQANEVGLDVLDTLTIDVRANKLSIPDALALAFQFGKRTQHQADQLEAHQLNDHELTHAERKAVQREMAARAIRQHNQAAESHPVPPRVRQAGA